MVRHKVAVWMAAVALLACQSITWAEGLSGKLREQGDVKLLSAGPLAFASGDVLLIGDPEAATVYALHVDDKADASAEAVFKIEGVDAKVAATLGTKADAILINDLAVNPSSGQVYLSVSRGKGPEAPVVIVRVDRKGDVSPVKLSGVKFDKAVLPNAPAAGGEGRNNKRIQSITDLSYVEGRIYVAGLSNEEFASNLRSIPFPFKTTDAGTSVEIFHGAHGKFETHSPVRTFTHYRVGEEDYLLAAYTCTPLVKIPVKELKPNEKIRGLTVAELGNRNRPLDMFVYHKNGKDYILMANSARGVMKIDTADLATVEPVTQKVDDKAGLTYETLAQLKGVEHLEPLGKGHAVMLVKTDGGAMNIEAIALP